LTFPTAYISVCMLLILIRIFKRKKFNLDTTRFRFLLHCLIRFFISYYSSHCPIEFPLFGVLLQILLDINHRVVAAQPLRIGDVPAMQWKRTLINISMQSVLRLYYMYIKQMHYIIHLPSYVHYTMLYVFKQCLTGPTCHPT
jgi:hypothetical protein